MNENRLVLDGVIVKQPERRRSPAGIEHCHFWLEHRSVQSEAGLSRQVYCSLQVVVSGQEAQAFTQHLALGVSVKVSGFLAYQPSRNGSGRLVLHAEHIETIQFRR